MSDIQQEAPFALAEVQSHAPRRTPESADLNPIAARAARQYRDDFITPRMLAGLWRATEFVLLVVSGWSLLTLYVPGSETAPFLLLVMTASGAAAGIAAIELAHGYDLSFLKSGLVRQWRVPAAWALVVALIAVALPFLSPEGSDSRPWLIAWLVGGTGTLLVARSILRNRLRHWGRNGRMERRVVLVGGGRDAETLIRALESEPESDIRICGIFDDRSDHRSPPIVAGYPKLGNIAELVAFARIARIDMLILTLPLTAEKRVLSLLEKLWVLPIDIRLSAHSRQLRFRQRTYSFVGSVPLIDVVDKPLADWDWIAKRLFDVVFASIALIVLSPVLIVTAIAVRLDSEGPIFFRQRRHGFNNQVIEILKFRSLYHAASDPEAKTIVTKGDKRVTRVGRFIRKTSLDELPQLINVLTGELSLVGPRPHAVHAISSENQTFVEIVDGYFGRHKVKPGITGWAQVNGWRGEVDRPDKLKKRFEFDLHYIENWSILFDLYILARTPLSLLKTESAY